jgi:heat shock protein HslJ
MKMIAVLLICAGFVYAEKTAVSANNVIAEYTGKVSVRQMQQYPLQAEKEMVVRISLESKDPMAYFQIKEEQGQSLIQLQTTEWVGRVPKGNYTVDVFLAGKEKEAEFRLRLEEIMSPLESSQKPDSDLINTRWKLVLLNGNEVETSEGGSDLHMTLRLEENKVNGYAGCNNFFGTYETSERTLRFSKLASTKRACPDMDLESEFLNALQSSEEYKIEGEQLTLYSNGEPIAIFEALYLQ